MASSNLFSNRNFFLIVVDVLMMLLLTLNLALIVFDWVYSFAWFAGLLQNHVPAFNAFYREYIHEHFLEIDLAFISIFLVEFVVSWTISIVQREYDKWFFYPIFHWYDLLGCIPLDAFRFVRILRVYSIVVRLHKLRVINLRNTYFYKKAEKYYDILVEEVSDRVVVNVLTGMQGEIRDGGQVMDRIVLGILKPKKALIAEWVGHRVKVGISKHYTDRKVELRQYIDEVIEGAVRSSEDVSKLERIPVMGGLITSTIKHTVSDVVFGVIETLMTDLSTDKNRKLVVEMTDFVFDSLVYEEEDNRLKQIVEDTLVESIEVLKDQVNVKQWKLKESMDSGAGEVYEGEDIQGGGLH